MLNVEMFAPHGHFCLNSLASLPSLPGVNHAAVNPWMVLPFAALLAAIALGPLWFERWWLRHHAKVALGLGAISVAYYLVGLRAETRVLHVAHEYVSFMALIGSLFVVSGG